MSSFGPRRRQGPSTPFQLFVIAQNLFFRWQIRKSLRSDQNSTKGHHPIVGGRIAERSTTMFVVDRSAIKTVGLLGVEVSFIGIRSQKGTCTLFQLLKANRMFSQQVDSFTSRSTKGQHQLLVEGSRSDPRQTTPLTPTHVLLQRSRWYRAPCRWIQKANECTACEFSFLVRQRRWHRNRLFQFVRSRYP